MSRGRDRRWARFGCILLASLVLLLVGASPASAHSELERSDPPNGGVAAVGRSALTLWFTEVISDGASTFELRTSDGVRVPVEASVSEADERGIVRITTPPLDRATYVLDWNVLASDDGHSTAGSLAFGVGTRPAVVAPSTGGFPGLSGPLLRWIDLSAIILAIGAVAVSGRVFGAMGASGVVPRRRSISIGAVAASTAVISGAVTPLFLVQRGDSSLGAWVDVTWATLIGTGWGQLWLARGIALLLAAGALIVAARSNRTGLWLRIAGVALLGAVVLEAWSGHASTVPGRAAAAVVSSAFHLVAAGIWAGGLVVVAICLIPMMRRQPSTRGRVLATAWQSFSPMAAVATVVLLATGLYEAGVQIPDLTFVASTVYGGTVAVKVALLAAALVLAGINTLLINPGLATRVGRQLGRPAGWAPLPLRHFPKVVAAELLILVVAVGAAGVLTSVPASRDIASATRQVSLHSVTADGLFVTFEHVPAGPQQSRLIIRARSVVKLEPTPVTRVSAALEGSNSKRDVVFQQIEPGRYEVETAQLAPGAWSASVILERDSLPAAVAHLEWTVSDEHSESARPLEIATTISAVLLLAGLLVAVFLLGRRRPGAAALPSAPSVDIMSEKSGSRR
ncbi:hypothetical protein BH10ACT6_BH10ACT6_13850 [soil metagenome]